MTEEQLQIFLEDNRKSTAKAIEETVNGKIAAISRKIDEHNAKHEKDMEDIKPLMQGAAGLQFFWKFLVGMGAIAVAWGQLKANFHI